MAQTGIFIYAADIVRVAAFYESVIGLTRLDTKADVISLQSPELLLIIHKSAPEFCETPTSPPKKREGVAIKVILTVNDLGRARNQARTMGGNIFEQVYDIPGGQSTNAMDPEGNVFMVVQRDSNGV